MNKKDIFLILGSGPSLDMVNTHHMNQFTVVACNNSWRIREKTEVDPEYVVMTDAIRVKEFINEKPKLSSTVCIGDNTKLKVRGSKYANLPYEIRILQPKLKQCIEKHNFLRCLIEFSPKLVLLSYDISILHHNLDNRFHYGWNVVVPAIELALLSGAKKILLCGIDATSKNGDYSELVPSGIRIWRPFLDNPRITLEPSVASMRVLADTYGVDLIDCSGGALTSLIKSDLDKHV